MQVCPTDAIIMMKSFDVATRDRRELLLDKDRLHQFGLQFEPSWATGNLLRDMQTPPKAPKAEGPARQGRRPGGVSLEPIAFGALAAVLLASSLAVVLTKNLFHSVLYLALSLTATAGIFLALDAEFLAAVQLLLYAGGVVTIAVFAIVVTERLVGDRITQTSRYLASGAIVAAALFVAVGGIVGGVPLPAAPPPMPGDVTRAIGEALLTRFVLPFELLGVLFVAALLGALYFARPDE